MCEIEAPILSHNSSTKLRGISKFCPVVFLDLGVLTHFGLKKSDKKHCNNSQKFSTITSLPV